MENIKQVAEMAGLSTRMIRRRAESLGLTKRYEGIPGFQHRVFTEIEAVRIRNYTGKKRGRKRKVRE